MYYRILKDLQVVPNYSINMHVVNKWIGASLYIIDL